MNENKPNDGIACTYTEIETSGEIGRRDPEKSNTMSEKSGENASMGLQLQ